MPTLSLRHDWYQSDSAVVITILIKNIQSDQLKVSFSDQEVTADITVPEYQDCHLQFHLSHRIVPEQCSYKTSASKIEIKLKKLEGLRWDKLQGGINEKIKPIPQELGTAGPPAYPTSKKGKDWNLVEKEITKQEAEEKPEGEEALNQLFQQIYGKGSDEVKKAMNKSYLESGGTVLSTNWSEVAGKKVGVKPPDGMEFKKWDS